MREETYAREDVLPGVQLICLRGEKDRRDNEDDDAERGRPDVEPADIPRRQANDDVGEEHHRQIDEIDVPDGGDVGRVCKLG